ncbi:MAG: ABC transporter permease [Pseudolysinimonas sp.]
MSSVAQAPRVRLPQARRRLPQWIRLPLEWFALPLIIIGLWSLVSTFAPNTRFPAPVKIGEAFSANWINETFVTDVLPSLGRLAIGLTLAIVIGVTLGVVVGSSKLLREFLEPAFDFFRAIPPPMVVPVLIALLGSGDTMKIVVIATSMWPVLLNTIEGVRAVDEVQRETARSFRLPRRHRLVFLILPSASPQIMAGIRQAMAVALILMVISEMFLAVPGSLGYHIEIFKQNYSYAAMWSIIVLLGLIGLLMAVLFQLAERTVLAWYRGLKEAERA